MTEAALQKSGLTPAQARFVELERRREEAKQFFKDLAEATQAVADEIGVGGFFQDDQGIVYKIVTPKGRWVEFESIGYERTKRDGEAKGSLSIKEAREMGFEV